MILPASIVGPDDFVQTVLLVDDQALNLQTPEAGTEPDLPHPVASKAIVEALADQGLSCTILAPGTSDDPDRARVVSLARTADIVVLDWVLVPAGVGPRQNSLPILRSIVSSDLEEGGCLRLVVIYTGYERPGDIVDDVAEQLRGLGLTVASDGLRVTADNLHVMVLGKPDSRADIEILTGAELAARLVPEFTAAFADGLLRRVALASITAVRRSAHQLLTKFPAALDEAYLSHRGMTSPVAAEHFARQLVSDEISTSLSDATVERWVHQPEIDLVLTERLAAPGTRHMATNRTGSKSEPLTAEQAQDLLSVTRDGLGTASGRSWDDVWSLTGLFDASGDKTKAAGRAREADERFTILSMFSRHYAEPPRAAPDPQLGLGTVLERDDVHWLCMQPLCDGARLSPDAPTSFPLLPLNAVAEGADFDVVLPGPSPRTRLKLVVKLHRMHMPRFLPNDRGTVAAVREADGVRRVHPVHPEPPFVWVGQLRLDQAHRFAAFLGSSAGRIGLDEPEWSRRRAGRS